MLANDAAVQVRLDKVILVAYAMVAVDVDQIHGKEKGVQ